MEKDPHYGSYSTIELLEVQQNIDRDKFPSRAAQVDAELEQREKNGEDIHAENTKYDEHKNIFHYMDEEEAGFELILDFQGNENILFRRLFICVLIAVHVFVFGMIWSKTSIPEYQELPDYLINVENVRCVTRGHNDLIIESYGYNFYAVDIRRSLCRKLARIIPKESDVKIWHLDGIIFHLTLDDDVLLSHEYLRNHYRSNRIERQKGWFVFLFIFWIFFFKSAINAIWPGTFTRE